MNTILLWASSFALLCFGVAMGLSMIRMMRGPTAQDRVLALDAAYVSAMLILLVQGLRTGSSTYFEIALLIALFGFVSSVVLAKFLLRGEVIEP